ncbi:hypothetical protein J4434_01055 [Candidatus Woesearchaeota archaeon]|nr:hypothetical protein [Candidatus Woesearchaeota archaeon]
MKNNLIRKTEKTLRKLTALSTLLSASYIAHAKPAQAEEVHKVAVESTFTNDKDILKIRPYDHNFTKNSQRVDMLVGRNFGPATLYNYWKFDQNGRSWGGARLDVGFKALEDRLSFDLQTRYFLGLNEESKDEVYAIPTIYYQVFDFLKVGVMGYGKNSIDDGKKPYFFLGPSVVIKPTKHVSFRFFYGPDMFGEGEMIYPKIDYNH